MFNDFSVLTAIFYTQNSFVVFAVTYIVSFDGRTAGQLFPTVRGKVKGFRNHTENKAWTI